MSNVWYDKSLTKIGRALLDLSTLTAPKLIAIQEGKYTFSQAHEFLSDVPIGARLATKALTSVTFGTPEGWLDAANVTFTVPTVAAPTDYVAYYTMDQADISGATINDVSGSANTHNATMINSPNTLVLGRLDEAVNFDGVNQYATITDHADLKPTNFTVACWIKKPSAPSAAQYIFSSWNRITATTLGYGFALSIQSSGKAAIEIASASAASESAISNTVVTDGQWHHVAGTFDGTDLKIYIDGYEEASFTAVTGLSYNATNFVRIAALEQESGVTDYIDATPDDIQIFTRALTSEEMKATALSSNRAESLVIYDDTGSESTSPLLLFIDTANILPITTEADKDLEVEWVGSAIARL